MSRCQDQSEVASAVGLEASEGVGDAKGLTIEYAALHGAEPHRDRSFRHCEGSAVLQVEPAKGEHRYDAGPVLGRRGEVRKTLDAIDHPLRDRPVSTVERVRNQTRGGLLKHEDRDQREAHCLHRGPKQRFQSILACDEEETGEHNRIG